MQDTGLDQIEHVLPNFIAKCALSHLQPFVRLLAAIAFFSSATAQTPITIERSTTLEETLKPGSAYEYVLRLQRGESADLLVRQQGVDVVVEIRNPAGQLLDSIDGPTGRNGDEVAEIMAQESGMYRITVRPFDNNEPAGRYRLEVRTLRNAAETEKLLRTRREARNAAAQWLRARSVTISRSRFVPGRTRLLPLDAIAERVRVLGIGEATHGSRELNDLRFALTRYLIERHRFRVVALEASASNLSQVASYVKGDGELTPAMVRRIESKIWIGRRTRRELIEWVHRWNKEHPKDRVHVIGVDANENPDARETLRAFLGRAYGEDLLKRWTPAERELADADEQTAVFGDSGVDVATRQFLLEIVAMMRLDAPILKSRFGAPAFDAALEAAQTLLEFADFNSGSAAVINHSRDWYMAARVLRALEQQGASAKVVYWAHNAHVAHPPGTNRTAGALLRSTLGCEYAALALTFGEGAFVAQLPNDLEDRLVVSTLPPAPDESIESVLRELYSDSSLATWSCVTQANSIAPSVPEWLKRPHPMHWVGGLYTPGSLSSAAFRNFHFLPDFDGIAFLPRVTAEDIPTDRPLIPARKRGIAVAPGSIEALRRMFEYDHSVPLDVKEVGVEDRSGVHIHDISYQSPKGGRVTAYLVVPSDKQGKFAGVIFMHPRPGSRKIFLDEALSLAKAGAVSLLIDAPFSRIGESKRDFDPTVTKPEWDRDIYIQTVVDLQRGVDLLLSRSDVDPKRIGFIGYSYGAHTGAVLGGMEKRIKAYVLMSGAPSLTEFLRTSTIPAIVETRNSLTKEQQENYFTTLGSVDPINYVSHVAPAALFLQFGKKDRYPNEEMQIVYAKTASDPKLVKTYDAGHELNEEARGDRAEWLRKQLKMN